jgi:hypothetical protein
MLHRTLSGILIVLGSLAFPTQAQTIWYVDDDAPPGGDGAAWSTAFDALQSALDVAVAGDEIHVAGGTYIPSERTSPNDPRTATFCLPTRVALYGGYAGLADPNDPDARNFNLYTSVLNGDLSGNDDPNAPADPYDPLRSENAYHVVFSEGAGETTVLDGFTVTGGNANTGGPPHNVGGGVRVTVGSPALTHCTFVANSAWGEGGGASFIESNSTVADCVVRANYAGMGGGIACRRKSLVVRQCAITANTAEIWGGGICCLDFCTPTISDCAITENVSDDGGGGIYCITWADPIITGCTISRNTTNWYGGGIGCSNQSNPTVVNCTIMENETVAYGGGVACRDECSPVIAGCDISRNVGRLCGGGVYVMDCDTLIVDSTVNRSERSGSGGGVYCYRGTTAITGCELCLNQGWDGGGIECYTGAVTLSDCTVNLNDAEGNGGGVMCDRGSVVLSECTIGGNVGGDGGGVCCDRGDVSLVNCAIVENDGIGLYCDRGAAALVNCSIAGNDAEDDGAGAHCRASDMTLDNCILWGNTPSEIFEDDSGTVLVSHSDVQGGWPGAGNIDVAPLFAFANDAHLMPGSPGIDVGTADVPGGLPAIDRDGSTRVIDGDGDGDAVVDMGAYELDPNRPALTCSPFGLDFVTYADGPTTADDVLSIRAAGDSALSWLVQEDCPWLEVWPVSGESSGEVDEVTVTIDAAGLAYGKYAGILEVTAGDAAGSPQHVLVSLRVGQGYPTIQMRIDAAEEGDTVLVPDGIYAGPGNTEVGFRGKAITVRSEGGPDNCIIDCEHDGRGFRFEDNEGADSVLDGFTITNGDSTCGGAIHSGDGDPTIANCVIFGNRARKGGGVCLGLFSRATLTDCLVYENTAEDYGGGIYCVVYGRPTIANCIVEANRSDYSGGGITCDEETKPLIMDCLITANSAAQWGGGIDCDRSDAEIRNCAVTENVADLLGGGISSRAGQPTIVGCQITHNTATRWDGGGLRCSDDARILNCVIADNAAPRFGGGGISLSMGSAEIANCQITGNDAGYGGGISVEYEATPTVTNCTIARNTADCGGGLYAFELSNVALANSILWDNAAPTPGAQIAIDDPNWPATVSVTYSDVQDGQPGVYIADGCTLDWGPGNIETDPLFVDPDAGDYRPMNESPCIDAADNDVLFTDFADLDNDDVMCEEIPVDLDGSARRQDAIDTPDTGNGLAPIVDMGAFEFGDESPHACPYDFDGDNIVGLTDLAIVLGNYGSTSGMTYEDGDGNCDGDVDQGDLLNLLEAYGTQCE